MENSNIDPQVQYLFSASKQVLLQNCWEVINILNNLSEHEFGSVHYTLNDLHPGLIHYYIQQAKCNFTISTDINEISCDAINKVSHLYLARLYLLKKQDILKHYIEIEYSQEEQSTINDFIIKLSEFDNNLLATYSQQITIILSKLSFINFCRAMQVLDSKPGLAIHYVMDMVQYCYSYNPSNFDNDNIDYIYANEISKRRLIFLRENDKLSDLFDGSARFRLISGLLNSDTDNAEEEDIIDCYKNQLLNEIKTDAFIKLHIESELELFMSFANQGSELIENINVLLLDMHQTQK